MPNEPSWDDLFESQPEPVSSAGHNRAENTRARTGARAEQLVRRNPMSSRRDLRDRESVASTSRRGGDSGGGRPPKRRRRWIGVLAGLLSVAVVLGAGVFATATLFGEPIRALFADEEPTDYEGDGTGEVIVTITEGQIGEDIARTLAEAGVTRTYEAFYSRLLQNPDVSFQPGSYALRAQMSAQSALDLLLDPDSRRELTVLVQEGLSLVQIFELLSAGTGVPMADLEAAASTPQAFGLPPEAQSLEGFLFPATYTFQPGTDATGLLQTMVDRAFQSLDAAGVAPADRYRILTIAALIEREAGSNPDDFYRVSRVVQNRLDTGMLLQMDSTAHYGYAWRYGERQDQSVFSTQAELDDDNPYNTYVNEGLPIGPIGAPGDVAIAAAVAPAEGDWIFFVTVNLDTGETVFSDTADQHNAAVRQLRDWCQETQSPNCA